MSYLKGAFAAGRALLGGGTAESSAPTPGKRKRPGQYVRAAHRGPGGKPATYKKKPKPKPSALEQRQLKTSLEIEMTCVFGGGGGEAGGSSSAAADAPPTPKKASRAGATDAKTPEKQMAINTAIQELDAQIVEIRPIGERE